MITTYDWVDNVQCLSVFLSYPLHFGPLTVRQALTTFSFERDLDDEILSVRQRTGKSIRRSSVEVVSRSPNEGDRERSIKTGSFMYFVFSL